MGHLTRKFFFSAGLWLLLPGLLSAQTLQNSASGELNNLSLDSSQATVTLSRAAVVDAVNSTVTVDPGIVIADGVAFSTITVTLRDANNQVLAGRLVSLASSRGALDTVTQPLLATDANGIATGEIRSSATGVAQVQATDVADGVLLNMQPDVLFTQGEVLQLTKSVSPNRATVGDVVTYTITIQNTTTNVVGGVRIADTPAPVLAFLPGTARLDGVAIPDPQPGTTRFFDLGDMLPLADTNGNGVADPGEDGFRVLSYSMVVGAGARPGTYSNLALAVDLCDSCAISATASVDLTVGSDPLFDLGTIIGKVFNDLDGDGWQDDGEVGIGGAMVALDSGVYALTDEHGRYHFPAIDPGQRLIKLNLASIAGSTRATTRDKKVLSVTPGLLAKANFGVIYEQDTASIGREREYGLRIDTSADTLPDRITGNASELSLVVNGVQVQFADGDVSLRNTDANAIIHMGENGSIEPLRFDIGGEIVGKTLDEWTLRLWREDNDNVKSFHGNGIMPDHVSWDDTDEIRERLLPGRVYFYQLEAIRGGDRVTSRHRMFGVNRETSIALQLRGGAFQVDSFELTDKAKQLLDDAADIMREHADEVIRIYGHTDSDGTRSDNQDLSDRRANAALDYLVRQHGLSQDRFVVRGFGEDKPVASNDTSTGRELNRRVEIVGELTAVERTRLYETLTNELSAKMNGTVIDLDGTGQFSHELDDTNQDGVDLQMTDEVGQSIRTLVDLPQLQFSNPSGVEFRLFAKDDPRRRAITAGADGTGYLYHLTGHTDAGNVMALDGVEIDLTPAGDFDLSLTLHDGVNRRVVSAKNSKGLIRYANLRLAVSTSVDGEPVVAVAPIPSLVLQLPPKGIPMRQSNLLVPGFTNPGNTVQINGTAVDIDSDGRFIANVPLQPGVNKLTAKVTDADGYTGEIERDVNYSAESLFIMALADAKVSQIQRSGNLAAAGADAASETLTEGRVALYMKGKVLGKYLITAAFDTGQNELGELFSDVGEVENDRLITNLDPDTMYPVYGDDSKLVYDTDSQSKLYLALEGEQIDAVVGNYPLSLTDTELTAYQRTLFGARFKYESSRKTTDNISTTEAELFVAKINQVSVRDEIVATGGSLYFLSHADIIEGSEQVTLLVHDQHTGLLLQRIAQQRNVDYDVKYREGRLWFRRPISSVVDDGSLIGANLLSGNPVTVQVDYETPVDGLDAGVQGVRLKQLLGDGRFGIGGTLIEDDRISSQYSLQGLDAEFRQGSTRIVGEYAQSTGSDSLVFRSEDGGLQFNPVLPNPTQEGTAYKLAAEFDAGEWFGQPEKLLGNAYYKNLSAGFASNGSFSALGDVQFGGALTYKLSDRNTFLLRFDDHQAGPAASSRQTSLLWRHQWGDLAVESEYQDRLTSNPLLNGAIAAVRAKYQWSQQFSTALEHQAALSGELNSKSAAEFEYAISDNFEILGRVVTGPNGEDYQGGVSWDSPFGRLYGRQTVPGGAESSGAESAGSVQRTLIGAEAPFGDSGTLYTEYQWDHSGVQRGLRSIVGLRRDWAITEGLSLLVSGEQTSLQPESGGNNEQSALIGGASYDRNGIRFKTRNEWRKQTGNVELTQFASFNYGELRLKSGLTMLGEYRLSRTEDLLQADRSTNFEEAILGLAIRPVSHDTWNVLFKISRLDSEATPAQVDTRYDTSTADLLSADWSFQISRRIEWVGKQAFRKKLTELDPALELETNTSLSIQRLNFEVPWDFTLGVEYRRLQQDEAEDVRTGFLGELMWNKLEHIGIGAGYNFTDFSSDLRFDSDYSESGWFLRLQGMY